MSVWARLDSSSDILARTNTYRKTIELIKNYYNPKFFAGGCRSKILA